MNAADQFQDAAHKMGVAEDEVCNRVLDDGEPCTATIKLQEPENCSCHISPPCGACTSVALYCPECDWIDE